MKAIILAAGRGSRMKSLTQERPKCLVEFRGKPLLEWQLDALRGAGVSEIGVVNGYRGELLEGYGLKIFTNHRWADTNMVSSLECAGDWLRHDTCLVSYSDIFYDSKTVTTLMASTADLSISYDPNWLALWRKRFANPLDDAETFRIDKHSNVTEIGGKPASIEEVQGQYVGLLLFRPAGWASVERLRSAMDAATRDRMHMTGTLSMLIQAGNSVRGLAVGSSWGEVDSAEDLAAFS
jgi:choline kinase